MAIVIRCDLCQVTLRREAIALSLTKTARLVDKSGEVRVIDSGDINDYLLCARCASYLERCALTREPSRAASSSTHGRATSVTRLWVHRSLDLSSCAAW